MQETPKPGKLTYAASGVDVVAAEKTVNRIKAAAASTFNTHVLSELGSFGGMFGADFPGLTDPVLISSADGVGTKLKLAFMTGNHRTVGQDLVNHCVNDILVHGARGLFFLDYIGTGKLAPDVVVELVEGMAEACRTCGLALIGGEMAELPDFYSAGEYDLAGFIVGVVDRPKLVTGATISEGDVCLGLLSTGLHTNGYSLARKIVFDMAGLTPQSRIDALGTTAAEALMAVHRNYAPSILPLLESTPVKGMAHITGGGIPGNLKRILPGHLSATISRRSWAVPRLFTWLKQTGDIDDRDIFSAFNMGIGYIVVVSPGDVEQAVAQLEQSGETVFRIGDIRPGDGTVHLAD